MRRARTVAVEATRIVAVVDAIRRRRRVKLERSFVRSRKACPRSVDGIFLSDTLTCDCVVSVAI